MNHSEVFCVYSKKNTIDLPTMVSFLGAALLRDAEDLPPFMFNQKKHLLNINTLHSLWFLSVFVSSFDGYLCRYVMAPMIV